MVFSIVTASTILVACLLQKRSRTVRESSRRLTHVGPHHRMGILQEDMLNAMDSLCSTAAPSINGPLHSVLSSSEVTSDWIEDMDHFIRVGDMGRAYRTYRLGLDNEVSLGLFPGNHDVSSLEQVLSSFMISVKTEGHHRRASIIVEDLCEMNLRQLAVKLSVLLLKALVNVADVSKLCSRPLLTVPRSIRRDVLLNCEQSLILQLPSDDIISLISDTSAFDASLMEFLETIVKYCIANSEVDVLSSLWRSSISYGFAISKSLADLVYTAHVETRGSRKSVESGSDSVIQLGRHLSYAELTTVQLCAVHI